MIFAPLLNKTEEEIFQTVYLHFLKQKCRSVVSKLMSLNSSCFYRHPNYPKITCAIGVFIPDEDYDERMEGHPVSWLIARELGPEYYSELPPKYKKLEEFLSTLQNIHDHSADYDLMMKAYRNFAKARNFTIPTLGKS
jgi:hypothetical protein